MMPVGPACIGKQGSWQGKWRQAECLWLFRAVDWQTVDEKTLRDNYETQITLTSWTGKSDKLQMSRESSDTRSLRQIKSNNT